MLYTKLLGPTGDEDERQHILLEPLSCFHRTSAHLPQCAGAGILLQIGRVQFFSLNSCRSNIWELAFLRKTARGHQMLLSQSDGDHCACKLSLQQSKDRNASTLMNLFVRVMCSCNEPESHTVNVTVQGSAALWHLVWQWNWCSLGIVGMDRESRWTFYWLWKLVRNIRPTWELVEWMHLLIHSKDEVKPVPQKWQNPRGWGWRRCIVDLLGAWMHLRRLVPMPKPLAGRPAMWNLSRHVCAMASQRVKPIFEPIGIWDLWDLIIGPVIIIPLLSLIRVHDTAV